MYICVIMQQIRQSTINYIHNTDGGVIKNIQELSYRKQIARQLRKQYGAGIYKPKYYTVTLKCRLRVTRHRRLDEVQVHSAKGDVSGQRAVEEEDTGMVSCCRQHSEEVGRLEREKVTGNGTVGQIIHD